MTSQAAGPPPTGASHEATIVAGDANSASPVPPHARFTYKRDIVGIPVYVSYLTTAGRNLYLEPLTSRVLCKHEIHELITTGEQGGPGDHIIDVAYIGFFEVAVGGSLRVGDVLRAKGTLVGTVIGFDLSHIQNHLNIVVRCPTALSGRDLDLTLDDEIRFTYPQPHEQGV